MDPRCCLLSLTKRCFGKKPCGSFLSLSRAYLRASTLWVMETFKAKCKAVFNSRGCFGCFAKKKVTEDSSRSTIFEADMLDYWSVSEPEMRHSSDHSQKDTSSSEPLNPSEFVNHGLILWNQTRQQWIGNKRHEKQAQLRKPTIDLDTIYESIRGNNTPLPHPIPLPEMVDFLVDVWEIEANEIYEN